MTEYTTIEEAKKEGKGNIIVKVLAISDITQGKGEKGTWQKQNATLQDNSGQLTMTMWNEDVGLLTQGSFYKLEGLFWKEYKGENQPQAGKYTVVKQATPEDFVKASMKESSSKVDDSRHDEQNKLPQLPEDINKIIQMRAIELLQIEDNVVKVLETHRPREVQNGQKIGMMTRTIFSYLHDAKVKMS